MQTEKPAMERFWFVWNPQASAPRYRHPTKLSAQQEARRLACKHPGQRFIVLRAIGGYVVPSTEPVKIAIVDDDGIPF